MSFRDFLGLGAIGVAILAIIGWVMNLVAVINMALDSAPVTAMFILRVVGVFIAFIGAVIGWF